MFSDFEDVIVCVQSGYSDQLSLLYSWQEDYDRAKYYANMARNIFYQVNLR